MHEFNEEECLEIKKEQEHLEKVYEKINDVLKDYERTNNDKSNSIKELKEYLDQHKISPDEMLNVYGQINNLFAGIEDGLKHVQSLTKIMPSPYFGNIEYIEDEENNNIYIGLRDVVDINQNSIISDWRAPISSLYYNSNLGKSLYKVENEEFEVELTNKKQISIKDGVVNYVFNSDTRIIDEILINTLREQHSSTQMKNIVQSIQNEQNLILRENEAFSIIINGVAGSGKTSVAMHRLAYLMYTYKNKYTSENILIISPNELFSNYIQNLLPELGEENAKTVSFRTLLCEHFDLVVKSETRSSMLDSIFNNHKARINQIQRKYDESYLNELCEFLGEIDISERVKTVYAQGKSIHLNQIETKYSLSSENKFRIYRKIAYLIDEIMSQKFSKVSGNEHDSIKEELLAQIVESLLKDGLYSEFCHKNNIKPYINAQIPYDNISTYAFIQYSILGFNPNEKYKMLFIDEIQDYDAVSLKIIKEMFPSAKYVLVGDIKQNLISTTDNLDFMKKLLPLSKSYNLTTCYRSTIEICELSNYVLGLEYQGQKVRHGKKPIVHIHNRPFELIHDIASEYDKELTLAVICKNRDDAIKLAADLPEFTLIDSEYMSTNQAQSTRIITTVHLSKGLEFDNVIIHDASTKKYSSMLEKQLFYTAITRALHEVHFIVANYNTSILLNSTASKFVETIIHHHLGDKSVVLNKIN